MPAPVKWSDYGLTKEGSHGAEMAFPLVMEAAVMCQQNGFDPETILTVVLKECLFQVKELPSRSPKH